jgi:hypothetical protein
MKIASNVKGIDTIAVVIIINNNMRTNVSSKGATKSAERVLET